jgi:hypothetical protein
MKKYIILLIILFSTISLYSQKQFIETYGSEVTLNCSSSSIFEILLRGNVTLSLSNTSGSKSITIWLVQDNIGSRTVHFSNQFTFTTLNTDSVTAAANATTVLEFNINNNKVYCSYSSISESGGISDSTNIITKTKLANGTIIQEINLYSPNSLSSIELSNSGFSTSGVNSTVATQVSANDEGLATLSASSLMTSRSSKIDFDTLGAHITFSANNSKAALTINGDTVRVGSNSEDTLYISSANILSGVNDTLIHTNSGTTQTIYTTCLINYRHVSTAYTGGTTDTIAVFGKYKGVKKKLLYISSSYITDAYSGRGQFPIAWDKLDPGSPIWVYIPSFSTGNGILRMRFKKLTETW